jgi:flagellar motor protein MotB
MNTPVFAPEPAARPVTGTSAGRWPSAADVFAPGQSESESGMSAGLLGRDPSQFSELSDFSEAGEFSQLTEPGELLVPEPPSPGQEAGEASAWSHLWADWHPVARDDEEETAPELPGENQVATQPLTVTTTFSKEALDALPDVLRAKPLVSIEATVPTEKILWMVSGAVANRGSEPGWADRLLIDLPDLPKAAPTATIHLAVLEAAPFDLGPDHLKTLHKFCRAAYPAPDPRADVLSVGSYLLNRSVEEHLDLPAGSVAKAAGLPTQLPADRAPNYKIILYALLPRSVGAVVAPVDHRALRGFAFDKSTLTAQHEQLLDSLAREVTKSWYSRSIVTRIVVQGHTDPVGTHDYNYALGRRRAEAVAARLKALISQYAGSLPAGTVDKIQYVIESYGPDRPFSSRLNSLNRRVELTLYRDTSAPPTPLRPDQIGPRLRSLLTAPTTLDPDTVGRIRCLLDKVQAAGIDDRFATDTQVFLINRDNRLPAAEDWSRVLNRLLAPELFGPQLTDDRVLANLSRLDEDIAGGVAKMNQIIDYASGADYGLGLLALAKAFKDFNAWVIARMRDPASIYSCYAALFL